MTRGRTALTFPCLLVAALLASGLAAADSAAAADSPASTPGLRLPGVTELAAAGAIARRADRTMLLTKPSTVFKMARFKAEQGDVEVVFQAFGAAPDTVQYVGALLTEGLGHGSRSTLLVRAPVNGRSSAESLSTLEYLYAFVARGDPESAYCLGQGGVPCEGSEEFGPQDRLLAVLADARNCVAGRLGAVTWRTIRLQYAAQSGAEEDRVAAQVTENAVPLSGVSVAFFRRPHSSCFAETAADGVAACKLIDAEGHHDHAHDDVPVIATYAGELRPERVRPPVAIAMDRTHQTKRSAKSPAAAQLCGTFADTPSARLSSQAPRTH